MGEEGDAQWKVVEISIALSTEEADHVSLDYLRQIVRNASEHEADVVIITGNILSGPTDRINESINVLNDEMASAEHAPCVMVSVHADTAGKISDKYGSGPARYHKILLDSGSKVQVPSGMPVDQMETTGPEPGPPFFNTRSGILKKHLFNAWKRGVGDREDITIECFLACALELNEFGVTLSQFLGITRRELKAALDELSTRTVPIPVPGVLFPREVKDLLALALDLAREEPDSTEPGLMDIRHVAGALALTPGACRILKLAAASREDVLELLGDLFIRDLSVMGMGELTRTLKQLRSELLEKIFGQDHAVNTFVEGLFSAEVLASADKERKKPRAVFLFTGPPGVGKTFLAENGTKALGRTFERFDMSSYSDHQVSVHLLTGVQRSYQGAHPGELTGFVKKHPNAVLLFDEIEKAHLNVIHLFLQILDQGTLEDQFTEEDVSFRDTIIIFTTNAGRKLYDDPNASGVHMANTNFQRKTILNALESEKDQRTGRPFFPQAIVSRMATGYPLMFNHLGVNELERIAAAEIPCANRLFQMVERVQMLLPLAVDNMEHDRA